MKDKKREKRGKMKCEKNKAMEYDDDDEFDG
jgi:hypothetical protein